MRVPPAQLNRVRVLVIDDDARYLKSLAVVLMSANPRLEVAFAETVLDGMLELGRRPPEAVLLDAYLPGMDGLQLCKRLKTSPETAHIAVMAMSGRHSPELENRFLAAEAAAFFCKPFHPSVVLSKLGELGLV